jgi:hypothetical protein
MRFLIQNSGSSIEATHTITHSSRPLIDRRVSYLPAQDPPFRQLGQRSFSSTPRSAIAICIPHPAQEAFPQLEQLTFLHIVIDSFDVIMNVGRKGALVNEIPFVFQIL